MLWKNAMRMGSARRSSDDAADSVVGAMEDEIGLASSSRRAGWGRSSLIIMYV